MEIINRKNLKVSLILLSVLFILITNDINAVSANLEDMELIEENKYLSLYLNKETTEIAVREKVTNEIWYSNPPGSERYQISFDYYDERDTRRSFNNYSDSVQYDQYDIETIDNGVRINYEIGKRWDEEDVLPFLISKERMEQKILNQIDEEDQELLLDNYTLITLKEADEDIQRTSVELRFSDFFGEYTLYSPELEDLEGKDLMEDRSDLIWELFDILQTNREDIETMDEINEERNRSFLVDRTVYIRRGMPSFIRRDVIDVFRNKAEYSPIMAQQDHMDNDIDPPEPGLRRFKIPVEYTLNKDEFIANIPFEEIDYPVLHEPRRIQVRNIIIELEPGEMPIVDLDLLRFFGNSEDAGYVFYPDGSGAIINYPSEEDINISSRIYGPDLSIEPSSYRVPSYQGNLPVFGFKGGDNAYLGIIEEGKPMTRIRSQVGDTANIFPSISPFLYTSVSWGGASFLPPPNVYSEDIYQGNFKIRYVFLSKKNADYVGMAKNYREYLKEKNKLEKRIKKTESDIPLYLELMGAIDVNKPVWGIVRNVPEPLTKFEQAKKIIKNLKEEDINNMVFKYTGWLKGGYKHLYPQNIEFESSLGSEQEFLDLADFISNEGIDFYPEVSFLNVYDNTFNPRRKAARYLDQDYAQNLQFNIITQTDKADESPYLLTPRVLSNLMNDFSSDLKQYNINNLSLRNIGNEIYSDYQENNNID